MIKFMLPLLALFAVLESCGQIVVDIEELENQQCFWEKEDKVLLLSSETDWLSTTRNFVLKESELSGNSYLSFSKDYGKTWISNINNVIGTINFVHWFSDGTCLICTPNKCYWTSDYKTLNVSNILDEDGSALIIPVEEWHFNVPNSQSNELALIDGKEYLLWGDYCGEANYSSVWSTKDCGHTIQRVLKNNVSSITNVEGNEVPFVITHVHKVTFDNLHNCYWITTGDYGSGCKLIRADIIDGDWHFTQVLEGPKAKFVGVMVDEEYIYFVTDYTNPGLHNGLLRCSLEQLGNIDNYEYLWQVPNEDVTASAKKICLSNIFKDDAGNIIITGDDGQFNVLWYAYRNYDFKEIHLISNIIERFSVHYFVGPNFNGDLIAPLTTYGWSGGRDRMGLNRCKRVLISTDFRKNGAVDFGKNMSGIF